MENNAEIRVIAAHLTAALIVRYPVNEAPVIQAAKLFSEMLEELTTGNDQITRELPSFYESSNGDVWTLTQNPVSGTQAVKHQPNPKSGGKVCYIDVEQFLRETPTGPQHQALKLLMKERHEQA